MKFFVLSKFVLGGLAVAALSLAGHASANAIHSGMTFTFDFDTDGNGAAIAAGQVIDDEYASKGLIISAMDAPGADGPALNYAVAQQTTYAEITPQEAMDALSSASGGLVTVDGIEFEPDHITAGFGLNNDTPYHNVLIVPRNATGTPTSTPDRPGAKFDFTFTDYIYQSGVVTILDVDTDEHDSSVEAFLNGVLVGTFEIKNLGNNAIQEIDVNVTFDALRVNLGGSGAIAELSVTAVPSPATGLLLLAGAATLFGRRRQA